MRHAGNPGDVQPRMSVLPDPLPITPFTRPVRGEAVIPGSKSLTNRALLLAALCDRPVTLTGTLFSEDTDLMAGALRQLGFTVAADTARGTVQVAGQHHAFPEFSGKPVELFVGLAGTAARFLTALCAAAPRGVYRLNGIPQMRKRPMQGLIAALRALGADLRCLGEEGFFPLEIHACGLRGGAVDLDAHESSQLLSALLMVAPLAREPLTITLIGGVRWPFVQMTARLMEHFGQPPLAPSGGHDVRVTNTHRYTLPAGTYAIEPDATAASYYLALPLVAGGRLTLPALRGPGGGLQGDTQFVEVLRAVGATIAETPAGLTTAHLPGAPRVGVTRSFNTFSDTFLTLAALAPLLAGPTTITGIAHTRQQETDRVAGMARELRRLGQDVVETDDALTITPRPLPDAVEIETYGDHRFAMSFGILGCHDRHGDGRPWLRIQHPACCGKTFPHFFELLEQVRRNSIGACK